MKQQEADDTYETYDLALTCALLTYGYQLREMDTSDGRKTGFVFSNDNILQSDIEAYWNNRLRVNPKLYFNTLKDLKSRIYANKQH